MKSTSGRKSRKAKKPAAASSDEKRTKKDLIEELVKLRKKAAGEGRVKTDRKKAREELRSIFELSQDMICTAGLDGFFKRVNPAFKRILGYTEKDMLAKPFMDFVHPEDRVSTLAALEKQGAGRSVIKFENRYRCKDGSYKWLAWSSSPLPGTKLVQAIARDVTRIRQAEFRITWQRDLALALSSITRLEPGLAVCLYAATEITGMDCGGIYLVDEQTGTVDLKLHQCLPKDFVKAAGHFEADSPHAKIVMNGEPVYTEHLLMDVPLKEAEKQEKLRALAIVPILYEKRVIGCINVASHTLDDIDNHTRMALETIAPQIGNALSRLESEDAKRQAVEDLRQSEARFRSIFESKMIGTLLWNANGDITDANDVFLQMVGYTRDEILSGEVRWRDITPPEYTELDSKALEEIAATGVMSPIEKEYICKDGSRIPILMGAASLPGPTFSGVAYVVDITDRVRAQEALVESQERLKAFMDSAIDGMTLWDSDFNLVEINPMTLKMFPPRTKKEDLIGRSALDIVPNLKDSSRYDEYMKVMRTGEPFIADDIVPHPKFGERHLTVKAFKVGDGLGIINSDITAQKLVERELAIRNRLAEVFLTVLDEEMYADILQILLEVMESEFGVFGYLDEKGDFVVPSMTRGVWEKCNVPDKDIVFPRDTWGDTTWPRTIREKKTIWTNERSIKIPEGHLAIFRHISMPIVHRGEAIGLIMVANKESDYIEEDIKLLETIGQAIAPILFGRLEKSRHKKARRVAEEQKELTLEDLRRSNTELEQFAYVASHDLQEPLRMVSSYVHLLERRYKDKLDDDARDFIGFAVEGANRMKKLVEDLLIFSRVGTREKEPGPVDTTKAVKAAIANLGPAIEEAHARVEVDTLPPVMGDETQLMQLFQNLIANGVKFRGEEAPKVHVSAKIEGSDCLFKVKDNGIGIDPKFQDRVFIIFQRLHGRAEYSGTGIGLAVSKKIVERHGGRIWFESEPGKGSTFYFTIPVRGGSES